MMLISVPGKYNVVRYGVVRYEIHKGFSLIELLLVIAVLGISLTVITPNLARNHSEILNDESLRLVSLLNYASDASISTGRPLLWEQTPGGYRFLERDEHLDIWKPALETYVLRERQLPEKIHIESASNQYGSTRRVFFSAGGVSSPYAIMLSNGEQKKLISGNLIGQASLQAPSLQPTSLQAMDNQN